MGIVNATPDSFFKDSRLTAVSYPLQSLINDGAQIIDIGAESTRPGAQAVSSDEEWSRLEPLLTTLPSDIPVSIDTQKASVAQRAFAAGASVLNDISALRHDPLMASVAAQAKVPVILMHMQGRPETMQQAPTYINIVDEIISFFEERMRFAIRTGIAEDHIILDPGIGFGKTLEHNVTILQHLPQLKALGRPLLVGVSRKTIIGTLSSATNEPLSVEDRLEGSLAAHLWAIAQGADGVRVHDVRATVRALRTWLALAAWG